MRPIDRDEFRRSVRHLDQRSLTRLVADTWRARGADVTIDGTSLAVSEAGRTRRVRVLAGPLATRRLGRVAADPDIDAVVVDRPVRARPDGVDVVEPDDLREELLYALPRETAAELAATHLGRPLLVERTDPAPPLRERLPVDAPSLDALPSSAVVVVSVLAVLVLVVSAGGLWAPENGFGGSSGDGRATAGGDSVAVGDAAGSDAAGTDAAGAPSRTPTPDSTDDADAEESRGFPPGLGPDGITEPYRLAEAHADVTTGQSYTLSLTYVESTNGTERSRVVERVEVASPTNYATNVTAEGVPRADPPVVADVEAYADGSVRWERRITGPPGPDGEVYSAVPTRTARSRHGYYADRVERYLGWYLSVRNSTIDDAVRQNDVTYYWVRLGPDSYTGVRNASGWALVTDEGLVLRLERTYETPDAPNATATVRLQYTNRDDAPVAEPPWVVTARNETRA